MRVTTFTIRACAVRVYWVWNYYNNVEWEQM